MQLKDINRGAFGVVVLAEERATGQKVAIKFIKRGPRVTKSALLPSCMGASLQGNQGEEPCAIPVDGSSQSGMGVPASPVSHQGLAVGRNCQLRFDNAQSCQGLEFAAQSLPAVLKLIGWCRYVLREILNHRSLIHPHIVQFKEVSCVTVPNLLLVESRHNHPACQCKSTRSACANPGQDIPWLNDRQGHSRDVSSM